METVRRDGPDAYTQWLAGYPDFPMPQALRTEQHRGQVTVSCQVYDIDITWQLTACGAATTVRVHADLTESEADHIPFLHAMLSRSLGALTSLAESDVGPEVGSPTAAQR